MLADHDGYSPIRGLNIVNWFRVNDPTLRQYVVGEWVSSFSQPPVGIQLISDPEWIGGSHDSTSSIRYEVKLGNGVELWVEADRHMESEDRQLPVWRIERWGPLR